LTDYTKATNFASKDSLSTGNPLKIVKGTEIDTEFNNIQTAIATKADLASPTFSGSVTIVGGTITGITDLAVADGGTGASDATTARSNLSAAKSGANSDITSITGLTTPLTVAQGGIGVGTLTANNVLLGNGTSAPQTVAPGSSGNVLTSNGTTWASAPLSTISGIGGQVFNSSGTFTIPSGVTLLKVTVIGGGGGGQYYSGCCSLSGGSGGTSSVSSGSQSISTISASGGAGGPGSGSTYQPGGIGSGGDINTRGAQGVNSGSYGMMGTVLGTVGGNNQVPLYGGGGYGNNGGSSGGTAIKYLTGLTPGNTLSVTVGGGGASSRQAGASGVVWFEW